MELGGEDVVAPAVVAGFGNDEELGEAWHLVAGYPSSHMSEEGMTDRAARPTPRLCHTLL